MQVPKKSLPTKENPDLLDRIIILTLYVID